MTETGANASRVKSVKLSDELQGEKSWDEDEDQRQIRARQLSELAEEILYIVRKQSEAGPHRISSENGPAA